MCWIRIQFRLGQEVAIPCSAFPDSVWNGIHNLFCHPSGFDKLIELAIIAGFDRIIPVDPGIHAFSYVDIAFSSPWLDLAHGAGADKAGQGHKQGKL